MLEATLSERLVGEGLAPQSWSDSPLDHYAEHRHDYDKVLVAVAGSITFHLPEFDRDVLLEGGDRLELPAGTLHGADVGKAGVTCLEAHLTGATFDDGPRHIRAWAAQSR